MTNEFTALFERDLNKLAEEIKSYKNDKQIWTVKEGITNSAGNLCYHLVGNLNHFLGAVLGKNGYVRNREEEFAIKDVPASELVTMVEKVKEVIVSTLGSLSEEDLNATFPVDIFGSPLSTRHFILHLYGHLNYHLGQINYHRRLTGE